MADRNNGACGNLVPKALNETAQQAIDRLICGALGRNREAFQGCRAEPVDTVAGNQYPDDSTSFEDMKFPMEDQGLFSCLGCSELENISAQATVKATALETALIRANERNEELEKAVQILQEEEAKIKLRLKEVVDRISLLAKQKALFVVEDQNAHNDLLSLCMASGAQMTVTLEEASFKPSYSLDSCIYMENLKHTQVEGRVMPTSSVPIFQI